MKMNFQDLKDRWSIFLGTKTKEDIAEDRVIESNVDPPDVMKYHCMSDWRKDWEKWDKTHKKYCPHCKQQMHPYFVEPDDTLRLPDGKDYRITQTMEICNKCYRRLT